MIMYFLNNNYAHFERNVVKNAKSRSVMCAKRTYDTYFNIIFSLKVSLYILENHSTHCHIVLNLVCLCSMLLRFLKMCRTFFLSSSFFYWGWKCSTKYQVTKNIWAVFQHKKQTITFKILILALNIVTIGINDMFQWDRRLKTLFCKLSLF